MRELNSMEVAAVSGGVTIQIGAKRRDSRQR